MKNRSGVFSGIIYLVSFICLTLGAVTASADIPLDYVGSALWSGYLDAEIVGNTAFCYTANGLILFDVSDPLNLQIKSRLYLTHYFISDLKVVGNFVYLTQIQTVEQGGGKLYIVDVSNQNNPVVVGSFDILESANGVDISGNLAFVAYTGGLQILDITNPSAIIQLADMPFNFGRKVRVRGNYAYFAGNAYLHIIDITDPTQPTLVSKFRTGYPPSNIELRDGDSLVFVAENSYFWPDGPSAFSIFNVADPANPTLLGRHILDGAASLSDIDILGNLAYVPHSSKGLLILDISDPTSPDSLGMYLTPGMAFGVGLNDTIAYVFDGGIQTIFKSEDKINSFDPTLGDIHVVNISDPTNPTKVSTYPVTGPVTGITYSGNYAYAFNSNSWEWWGESVMIVDATDPANPVHVGSYITPETIENGVVADSLLFLAVGYGGYEIINVADKANPYLLWRDTTIVVGDIALRSNYAYVAAVGNGLLIFDITNPSAPVLISRVPYSSSATFVSLVNNLAYVTYSSAIVIVDISDPKNPLFINSIPYSGWRCEIDGNIMAVMGTGGFLIFDLTDPLNPVYAGEYGGIVSLYDIKVLNGHVLASSREGGVKVIDVTDPSAPFEASDFDTPGQTTEIAIDEDKNRIYVADHWSMAILEYSGVTSIDETEGNSGGLPTNFTLHQNYPNPFNPVTTISYDLPSRTDVTLSIYNILGQEVATLVNGSMPAGHHSVTWETDSPTGIYFYQLKTGGNIETKKMILIK